MKEIKWDFSIPLKNTDVINKFEKKYSCVVPNDLKDTIIEYNAGVPSRNFIDIHNNCVPFNSLLSWNIDDDETVYIFVDDFIDEGILLKIPFGVDGFGNVFVVDCINDNKIKLWFHETDEYYLLADSFSEFVNKLHE